MSLFESYEEEIKVSFKQFEQIAAGFPKLLPEQKQPELDKLENLLSTIEGNLSSLNLESNRTGKSTQQYFTQFYAAKRTYQQFRDKYQDEKNYADLIPSQYHDFNTTGSQTQRDRVVRGNKTLENGIQMIRMANDQVREDKKTAESTLEQLATQKERLIGFEKKFDSIDGYLDKAKKTIGQMSRRAMANKFIMAGIIFILLIAIGLIIWLKFVRTGGSNNNSSGSIDHSSSIETTTTTTTPSPTPSTTTTTTTTSTGSTSPI
ncbi:hypothetical protein RB653_001543 [Dictyostelium firmibasis]|uniref:Uncharacterized protein n=1 Tax=Dictyostelium firmibasis TaxID=79012 RepID=A0AAN7UGV9_9MYCE